MTDQFFCGKASSKNLMAKVLRERGILAEIELENIYHNPHCNYSLWDMVLFSKVKEYRNITCLFNCSCNEAMTDINSKSVCRKRHTGSNPALSARKTYFA